MFLDRGGIQKRPSECGWRVRIEESGSSREFNYGIRGCFVWAKL